MLRELTFNDNSLMTFQMVSKLWYVPSPPYIYNNQQEKHKQQIAVRTKHQHDHLQAPSFSLTN